MEVHISCYRYGWKTKIREVEALSIADGRHEEDSYPGCSGKENGRSKDIQPELYNTTNFR